MGDLPGRAPYIVIYDDMVRKRYKRRFGYIGVRTLFKLYSTAKKNARRFRKRIDDNYYGWSWH